jgi:hypothetical protein
MIKQAAAINDQLDQLMISYTSTTDSIYLNLSQTEISIQNNFATQMSKVVNIGSASFTDIQGQMSIGSSYSYCNLVNASLANSSSSVLNCTALSFIQKTALSQIAVAGENGRKCNVDSSKTLTLSFFQSSSKKLSVKYLTSPISLWIPRVSNLSITSYQSVPVNSLSSTKCLYNDVFLQNSIQISGNNSIHIQFKPSSSNVEAGYLLLLKFGDHPTLNSTAFSNYDLWKLYCPNDTITQNGDTFFLFFANMSTVNGYQGLVGFAMRELSVDEMSMYCPNKINTYNLTYPPILDATSLSSNLSSSSNETSNCKMIFNDLSIRVYLSGCYYMDTSTGSYSSYGTEVLSDTNIYSTHCQVTHCTEFAGGFIVLPAQINFEAVWANASIDKNPVIYATVFTIIGLYIGLAVLCRLFDVRDRSKKGITMLNGNRTTHLYEIIIFTGNRRNGGTDSRVSIFSDFSE